MPSVFIPPSLRTWSGGEAVVDVGGSTVGEVVEQLDARYPGIRRRICRGDELAPGLSVTVGSSISELGMHQPVDPDAEIHFLPAIGGG